MTQDMNKHTNQNDVLTLKEYQTLNLGILRSCYEPQINCLFTKINKSETKFMTEVVNG